MTHILLKMTVDYADEFNCHAIAVAPKEKWEDYKEKVRLSFAAKNLPPNPDWMVRRENVIEVGFGTNECLHCYDFDDWISQIKEIEIDEQQYSFFLKNFGKTWGTGDGWFYILDYLEDSDDLGEASDIWGDQLG